jgi:hypothetical protein
MRLRLVLPLLPIVLAACSGGVTNPAGTCVAGARVNDTDYGQYVEANPDRVGPEFTRTLRQRGCEDAIEFGQPAPERWRNGDSSFPAGTPLYASLDEPTSEVLLVARGDGRFVELRRLPHPGSPAAGDRR